MTTGEEDMTAPIYEIPVRKIDGSASSLGEYAGDVLLVVNVASACGLTPQYVGLEKIYEKYRDKGFKVLGFPANDFAAQEPGSNDEILDFCTSKYSVQFPMFQKIAVKGETQHPLYHHLTTATPNTHADKDSGLLKTLAQHGLGPTNDTDVVWNFEKFLVGKHGDVVARFAPDITPDDPRVTQAIESELNKA
jgi:glutathione peroxidase